MVQPVISGISGLGPTGTQCIQRASLLLKVIASHNRLGLRVVDICKLTTLQRPTVHRMLQCLVAENLVARHTKTRNYHLGQVVYELGLTASPAFRLRELCEPFLTRLADATEDFVFLTVRSGFDAVCIDRKEGRFPIRSYTLIGTRRPLGIGAGGLAILSTLDKGEIDNIMNINAPRLCAYDDFSVDKLRKMIKQTKTQGYGTHDGSSGARAIGIPILNSLGVPFAAVSVSGISQRMERRRCKQLLGMMRTEVTAIENVLRVDHC